MEGLNKNLIEDNNNEDFNFLSEEELLALDDGERSAYYRKLEEKEEEKQNEYYSKTPENDKDNLINEQGIVEGKELDTSEDPGYELHGRFNKFKENKKRKTTKTNRPFNGPRNPLFNPYR